MTDKDKKALESHVILSRPINNVPSNGEIYFLQNDMIIEFTGIESFSNNSKYQINNSKYNWIWFSQFSNIFFNIEDLKIHLTTLQKKNGERKAFTKYNDLSFWEEVKGKKYKVCIEGKLYTFNKKSNTVNMLGFRNLQEVYDYILNCINEHSIDKIGDLLKIADAYSLIEI